MSDWNDMERRTVEMSFIALAGFWYTTPTDVESAVARLMERMLPRFRIVWGPAAHQPAPELPGPAAKLSDALVFVCEDEDSGDHYVVFRGTNTISPTEWLLQDFMVQKRIPWREVLPGSRAPEDALVSEGTANAIALRKDLRPGPGSAGEGVSLAAALLGIALASQGRCAMRFTGHSLGGLLAPAMALWFLDFLDAEGHRDLEARMDIEVYGYAAPTAGNRAFADYLSSRLEASRRYANGLDVATLVWDEEAMRRMPGLYEPHIRMSAFTKSLHSLCMALCEGKGYAQPGEAIPVPARVIPARRNLFLLEAAYQHCIPYLEMLQPERKEAILREVVRPLADLASSRGLKPVDLKTLFEDATRKFRTGGLPSRLRGLLRRIGIARRLPR